jgi:hypothetical protein
MHDIPPRGATPAPTDPQSRERELREGRAGRRSSRVENPEKCNGSLATRDHFASDHGCGDWRQEGKNRCEGQPRQRCTARGQECRKSDQGNAGDGNGPAGLLHSTSHCNPRHGSSHTPAVDARHATQVTECRRSALRLPLRIATVRSTGRAPHRENSPIWQPPFDLRAGRDGGLRRHDDRAGRPSSIQRRGCRRAPPARVTRRARAARDGRRTRSRRSWSAGDAPARPSATPGSDCHAARSTCWTLRPAV